ncbi:MAG: ComF family protein [Flavobacteriales bacterium]
MWRAWLGLGRCWGCGTLLLANEVAGTCPGCRLAWPVLPPDASSLALGQLRAGARPWALGFRLCDDRGTSQVLHRMKYGGLAGPAKRLGRWMAATWPPPPHDTVLVPVPSHWRRWLRRGFNPSESLARGLSHTWGCSVEPSLLARSGHRRSLTGSSRAVRMRVLQACYVSKPTATPRNVVLVDDVLTTGATYRICAQALAAEGHTCLGGVWLALA